MFRAETLWLANGPTLKMDGKLVGEWAEQARDLVTAAVVPKGLIVDLTDVTYVDSAGERLLSWLGSVGAVFVAAVSTQSAYANVWVYRPFRGYAHGGMGVGKRSSQLIPIHTEADRNGARKRKSDVVVSCERIGCR